MKYECHVYISIENYKGGINNLFIAFDKSGIRGTSTKSPQTAYKNYLRNRKNFYRKQLV